MNQPLLILIGTQLLFSTSDFMGRWYMSKLGFHASSFFSWWFVAYFLVRTLAMFGMLYVFSHIQLGRTMALFGASSILLANVLGLLVLREVLSPTAYAGASLAIIAFLILAWR